MKLDTTEATDRQLLSRFETGRDQRAFAEIVRRHGSMVLATATRIVGSREDAEDAFQATFFALAKGNRLRSKEALVGWLHQTAQRCAQSIRRANIRRTGKLSNEFTRRWATNVDAQTVTNVLENVANDEIATILDEELSTLPTDLQTAIILCELEGLSENQAAKQLGIPSSTLHDRLVKGRKLLKNGLVRRGVTVSFTGLTAYILSSSKTSAAVSGSLIADTTTKATLFAAGKTAVEIGVSSNVIHTANKVLSAMNNVKVLSLAISAAAFLSLVGVLSGVVGTHDNSARAGTMVIDTFNDKDFADGSPITWVPHGTVGGFDASSGDLVIFPSEETNLDAFFGLNVPEVVSQDQSVRVQARILETGHSFSVGARAQNSFADGQGYFATVAFLPQLGGSILNVSRTDSFDRNDVVWLESNNGRVVEPLSHDVREVDTILQIDVIGDRIEAWAWPAGGSMPDRPQYVTRDVTYSDPGIPSLGIPGRNQGFGLDVGMAIFRYVHVADMPIHQIVPDSTGDFDGNGTLDDVDLDLLNEQIKIGGHDAVYDLNADGQVTDDDRQIWVQDIAGAFLGDANLDSRVDSADLNTLALNWRKPIASWAAGDFTGDGLVDSADLNVLALNWRNGTNAAPVPEPSSIGLVLLSLVFLTGRFHQP